MILLKLNRHEQSNKKFNLSFSEKSFNLSSSRKYDYKVENAHYIFSVNFLMVDAIYEKLAKINTLLNGIHVGL